MTPLSFFLKDTEVVDPDYLSNDDGSYFAGRFQQDEKIVCKSKCKCTTHLLSDPLPSHKSAVSTARRNKCVSNIYLKHSSDSQLFSSSEFQTTDPETRKLLCSKRRVLVRGTVRSPQIADCRRALAPTSRSGLQVRLRYVGP